MSTIITPYFRAVTFTVAMLAGILNWTPMTHADDQDDVKALVEDIKKIEPWRQSKDYSEADWAYLKQVALRVQKSKESVVETALDAFMKEVANEPYNGDFESDSKPYLLMRVVFNLPEDVPATEVFSFKGWDNSMQMILGSRVNLAWPLTWKSGGPKLLARYEGSSGRPYGARAEYVFMKKKFNFR